MSAAADWMDGEEREASARLAEQGPRFGNEDLYPDPEDTSSRPADLDDALLSLAWSLVVKLPMTSAALRDGLIGLDKAETIAHYCSVLTPEEARQAEAMVIGDAPRITFRVLQDRIKAAVMEVNADAAARRREEAAKTRRVEVRGEDSGNASICGRELPSAAVLAANANLTARARQLKAHFRTQGIKAGTDELRAIAFMEAFNVTIGPLADRDDTDTADDDTAGRHSTGHDDDAAATRDAPARQADRHADGKDEVDGDSPEDGTGGSNGGGSNGGRGPAGPAPPAPVPRARCPPASPPSSPDGPISPSRCPRSSASPTSPAPPPASASSTPPRPATWPPPPPATPGDDGRPVAHGCARPAKATKTTKAPQSWAGPGTRDLPAFTPDDDHGPPGRYGPLGLYGRWRLNPAALTGNPGGQELIIDLEPHDGPCDHRHQAAGHDPGVRLRHLTGILNATCTFPPCRRPEAQSDYEHSRPHDQGGMTCLCEGGPPCM